MTLSFYYCWTDAKNNIVISKKKPGKGIRYITVTAPNDATARLVYEAKDAIKKRTKN